MYSNIFIGLATLAESAVPLEPMIERLADDKVNVSLAVSLNAPSDAVRGMIMPVNKADAI